MPEILTFSKIKNEDIFEVEFDDLVATGNASIEFKMQSQSSGGIAVLYAPNGTGKTSLKWSISVSVIKQIIKTFLLAGVPFGITMGLFTSIFSGAYIGFFVGIIIGFFFGLLISLFVLIQSKKFKRVNPKLNNIENILFDGGANHFKGSEAVGGWLYLTSKSLYFKSHNLNIHIHEIKIPLDQIDEVKPALTFTLIPNGLKIILKNNSIEKFVVFERKKWVMKISNAISNVHKIPASQYPH